MSLEQRYQFVVKWLPSMTNEDYKGVVTMSHIHYIWFKKMSRPNPCMN